MKSCQDLAYFLSDLDTQKNNITYYRLHMLHTRSIFLSKAFLLIFKFSNINFTIFLPGYTRSSTRGLVS